MKKLRIKQNLIEHLNKNKWQYLIALMCALLGVIAGSVTSVLVPADEFDALNLYLKNFVSAYSLQSVEKMDVFVFSIYNNIKTVIFMWISGLWIWIMPLSLMFVASKGFKLGFSVTAFIRIFGFKGIVFSAVSSLPQLLILMPALVVYAVFNIRFACSLQNMKGQRISQSTKNEMYFKNFLHLLGVITVSVICSLADAFVMPALLKPICSFLAG